MSAVVSTILIWRGWWGALSHENSGGPTGGLFETGHSAHVIGLGICAVVACLTTVTLVVCAVHRIRLLHAGVAHLEQEGDIAVSALTLRTGSAAIVALAVAAICAIALGM